MKTLVRWAVRLYPAAWRARYGVEMEALLEELALAAATCGIPCEEH